MDDVRDRGGAAVTDWSLKLDGAPPRRLALTPDRVAAARDALRPADTRSIRMAAENIRIFHEATRPEDTPDVEIVPGVRSRLVWRPLRSAGLYVPGGSAPLFSSLLMLAIPAAVAGVGRRVAVTPPSASGEPHPAMIFAAAEAGLDDLWLIGGAQAIAALTFGAELDDGVIEPCDKLLGPGNAWVAEAKRQLYGVVGIDMVAGPSEILVIADGKNDPDWIAADLLSQAEHDPTSQSILITDDAGFARQVEDCIDLQINQLATGKTARASWDEHGVIIVVNDLLAEAPTLANRLAAEHVEIAVDDPEPYLTAIRHAGSIFLGRMTPEAVGDYVAGPNHVLPTGRRARFSSGLSVLDFMKRTSFLGLDAASFNTIGPAAATLAHAEGLPAHAKSVELRIK
jgi:histidinol dehydrogenase